MKKKLTILLPLTSNSTLGIESRLGIIRYFTTCFDVNIFTNNKTFLDEQIDCDITQWDELAFNSISPITKVFHWKKIANKINKSNANLVFMFEYSAYYNVWITKKSIIYVSQYGDRVDNHNFIKGLIISYLKKINEYFFVRGINRSNHTFVVSEPLIHILTNMGVLKTELIPHAVYLEKYSNPKFHPVHDKIKHLKEQGHFIVSYTGWVSENRCINLMLDSIKAAVQKDDRIIFVIAGADDEYLNVINVFFLNNNLSENIINLGIIDVTLIPGILYYSDVCLSFFGDEPGFHVSPPQKVIEYFAAACPVICNFIGHHWLVKNEENGLIVEINSNVVAGVICSLSTDPGYMKKLTCGALKEARKYDVNKVYNTMSQIINEEIA